MNNVEIIEQAVLHLRDAAYLAAMIDRRPASDADWHVMKAMNLICGAEVLLRGLRQIEVELIGGRNERSS